MKTVRRITALLLALALSAIFPAAAGADDASAIVGEVVPAATGESGADNAPTDESAGIADESANIADETPFDVDAKSAVLMDLATGKVLYAKNASEALPPASVTKIMTLLLTMEALAEGRFALGDTVQVSEYAASMGGSQVFLKAGEELTVEELIKSTVIASANDAAVALAELCSGSVEAFVSRMNERAAQLGMTATRFENPTGLDDDVTEHVTSAYDIALMTRELSKHPKIFEYSSIWMDSIRSGAFTLTNTNRLVRFYRGATGLKTGSTAAAGFCISATAERDGMHLCAVIMGSPTRDVRNDAAKKLLDWGFSNYFVYRATGGEAGEIAVKGSAASAVPVGYGAFTALLPASYKGKVEQTIELPEFVEAPVAKGDAVGRAVYAVDGESVGEVDVTAASDAPRITFGEMFVRILSALFLK